MRIHANIGERTLRRKFTEPRHRQRPLMVIDHTLPAFGLKIAADDTRTFFVRLKRRLGAVNVPLGTAADLTAAEARRERRDRAAEFGAGALARPPVLNWPDFNVTVRQRVHRGTVMATLQEQVSSGSRQQDVPPAPCLRRFLSAPRQALAMRPMNLSSRTKA